MKFTDYIVEMSGKPYMTLQNMVAISRKKEDMDNTLNTINRAEKKGLIRPVEADRLRKELERLRKKI